MDIFEYNLANSPENRLFPFLFLEVRLLLCHMKSWGRPQESLASTHLAEELAILRHLIAMHGQGGHKAAFHVPPHLLSLFPYNPPSEVQNSLEKTPHPYSKPNTAFSMASSDQSPTPSTAQGTDPTPHGQPITMGQHVIDKSAAMLQSLTPVKQISQHVCTFALYSHDMSRQIETHHYVTRRNQDFLQCAVYDSEDQKARLIGQFLFWFFFLKPLNCDASNKTKCLINLIFHSFCRN